MKRIFKSKSGHSVWRTQTGRLVIKDRSGPTPEMTDDGVLYIDNTRKPVVTEHGVWLPLKKPDGEQVSTITSAEVYRFLRGKLQRNEPAVQKIDCPYCG